MVVSECMERTDTRMSLMVRMGGESFTSPSKRKIENEERGSTEESHVDVDVDVARSA